MENEIKDTYLTISSATEEQLFKDKGSKFFSYAYPVSTKEQAEEIVQNVRSAHHSARHCCYAWRVGQLSFSYRANDDGEPSGSAGAPIYNQILSAGVTNVLVVVVRYFGGVLLGVPGLVNAYKTAAQLALSSAETVEMTVEKPFSVHFTYPQMNTVMRIMKDSGARITGQDFKTECVLYFSVRLSLENKIREAFAAQLYSAVLKDELL